MNVLVYIIPIALGLGLLGLFAFLWALRSGQYSDVDGAALRVLSDDDLKDSLAATTAQVVTMSSTLAARDRSLIGLAKPCRNGPIACAPPSPCVSL